MTGSVARSWRSWRSWRVALRIARREVWRSKGRSALVVTMIGVPVMLVTAGAVFLRADDSTRNEATLRSLGAADALVLPVGRAPVKQGPTGSYQTADGAVQDAQGASWTGREVAVATGGRTESLRSGAVLLDTARGAISAQVREFDIRDPLFEGLATLTAGRAPARPDEVLVSEALAERGFASGERLRTDGRTLRVVGVARIPSDFSIAEVVGLPGSVLGQDADTGADVRQEFLIDTDGEPVAWSDVQRLNRLGLVVTSRAVLANPPQRAGGPDGQEDFETLGSGDVLYVVGTGSALLEIVLLAAPAFAVGARRQRREFALLAVAGGTPSTIRQVLLVQGLLLGGGAAAGGIALTLAALPIARPFLERLAGFELVSYDVRVGDLLLIEAVAALAAFAAASVPAQQAARQDPVAALAGRGSVRIRAGWPLMGVLFIAAGIASAISGIGVSGGGEVWVLLGTFAIVGGSIMALPAFLGLLGEVATWLPLSLRLAARDTARHRLRSAAAISAVTGSLIGTTALAIGFTSVEAEQRRDYHPRTWLEAMEITFHNYSASELSARQMEDLATEIQQVLPGRSAQVTYGMNEPADANTPYARLLDPTCRASSCTAEMFIAPDNGRSGTYDSAMDVLIANADELERLVGPLTAAQRETLRAGGVIVSHPAALSAKGTVRVGTYLPASGSSTSRSSESSSKSTELPGAYAPQLVVSTRNGRTTLTELVISETTAERLGLAIRPNGILVPPGEPVISETQQAHVEELVLGLYPAAHVYVERGFDPEAFVIFLLLGGIAGLIMLVGIGTATALSLADARADFATLAAVGASARVRRRQAMAQAGVIGFVGAVLGVVAGAVPGLAITFPLTAESTGGHIVDVPWRLLGLLVLGVPLLAVLGAGLLTRSRLPLIRRIA